MRKSTALRSCFLSFLNDTRLLMDNFQSAFTGAFAGESLPHPGTSLRLRMLHTPLGFSMYLSFERLILYQITKSAACFIGGLVTHVLLEDVPGLAPTSLLLLEQIRTVDRRRLRGYIGQISKKKMKEIDTALAISVGLRSLA